MTDRERAEAWWFGDAPRRPRREVDELVALIASIREDERRALGEVLAAARKCRRGCDCEYDNRCGRCQAVIDLREAVAKLDALATKGDMEAMSSAEWHPNLAELEDLVSKLGAHRRGDSVSIFKVELEWLVRVARAAERAESYYRALVRDRIDRRTLEGGSADRAMEKLRRALEDSE